MTHTNFIINAFIVAFVFFLFTPKVSALSDGFILCGAYAGKSTVLLDKNGNVAHTWNHGDLIDTLNGYSCYLLENGDLLRTAQVPINIKEPSGAIPRQGAINQIDPSGKLVWRYFLTNDTFMLHHDMKPLPNGNVLAVTFVVQTKAQMAAAGVDTTIIRGGMGTGSKTIMSERIIEIKPRLPEGGDIVWQWNMFDHVIPKEQASEHPELISGGINRTLLSGQWVHLNGIDYSAVTDLIVFSSRLFSELFVIDHGTTAQQAKSHSGGARGKGGDILYRWGKPANYGMTGGYTLDCLHCTNWIPEGHKGAGNILFFHNNSAAAQSEAVEIAPSKDGGGNFQVTPGQLIGPAEPTWKFAPGDGFYSPFMSSAIRMANGNTIIQEAYPSASGMMVGSTDADDTTGNSMLWEVTPNNEIVWKYRMKLKSGLESGIGGFKQAYNPAKIMYYPSDYTGIKNLFLRLGGQSARRDAQPAAAFPGMYVNRITRLIELTGVTGCEIGLYSPQGKKVFGAVSRSSRFEFSARDLPRGIFFVRITGKYGNQADRLAGIVCQ